MRSEMKEETNTTSTHLVSPLLHGDAIAAVVDDTNIEFFECVTHRVSQFSQPHLHTIRKPHLKNTQYDFTHLEYTQYNLLLDIYKYNHSFTWNAHSTASLTWNIHSTTSHLTYTSATSHSPGIYTVQPLTWNTHSTTSHWSEIHTAQSLSPGIFTTYSDNHTPTILNSKPN